jgi:hypothetical protein
MTTNEMLIEHVTQIVHDLENGIIITQEEMDDNYYDYDMYCAGDMVTAFDYLEGILDINYIISSDKQYIGAKICVAFGGPNIYIDTQEQVVYGYWGRDRAVLSYINDIIGIDDALEELYNC